MSNEESAVVAEQEHGGQEREGSRQEVVDSQDEAMTAQDDAVEEEPVVLLEASTDVAVESETLQDTGVVRKGTVSSATFNLLSTMVGGGCLSLPLAFQQCGNALLGPLLLVIVAALSNFCFRLLVASAVTLENSSALSSSSRRRSSSNSAVGTDSFESISSAAFGAGAHVFSMGLVTAMCFFGTVGYAVLLRDMLQPITDAIHPAPPTHASTGGPTLASNTTMWTVMILVTPFCTLQTLTPLKRFGAASMFAVLILGSCLTYRSFQCNLLGENAGWQHWWNSLSFWPESALEVLDALPLYVSCFVCHYNVLPVHNELQNPTQKRVSWWLRSTTFFAGFVYMAMGFFGSSYGNCTPTGKVQGNVLLDFSEDDPLLLVGRMSLALTITLAFPMLVLPMRDICIRTCFTQYSNTTPDTVPPIQDDSSLFQPVESDTMASLREPLLSHDGDQDDEAEDSSPQDIPATSTPSSSPQQETDVSSSPSFCLRLVVATVVFWSAAAVASCVKSIDVVWDLLGSSLSILLSYLIPCATYLKIQRDHRSSMAPLDIGHVVTRRETLSTLLAWLLILIFTPLMFLSTGNAVRNTFYK